MKNSDKHKESSNLKYWDGNNLCFDIVAKASVNNFECTKETSQFNENSRKKFNEDRIKDVFLMLIFNILNN